MKRGGRHAPGVDELAVERLELQAADQVRRLIERGVDRRSPDFALGVGALMADAVHQEVHGLLRRPAAEVIVHREHDACGAVQAPEEHADLLGRVRGNPRSQSCSSQ